ncbi:MAG: multicopper oxidase domain-containing protein [Chthoniobacteraceae bacterium]
MINRRRFLAGAGAVAGSATVLKNFSAHAQVGTPDPDTPRPNTALDRKDLPLMERIDPKPVHPPGEPGKDYTPVITPDNIALPWKIVDGVKVFHLVAEEVEHEFSPGLRASCWGYNGRVHGPTIEAVEGDRVRIYVTNNSPGSTSVHWHGLLLPNGMDGVAGLNQKAIQPGETYVYEFTLRQHGTHMYHAHHDEMTQMAMGMMGLFIIHPRNPKVRPDRDFAYMLSEWQIKVGTSRPNPNEMTDFNIFTFNAKSFPGTAPMVAKLGDRVRIRIASVAVMDHHPIHLHGYQFRIVATDGGPVPESAQQPETSVLVAVGQSRDIEFIADEPGDWAMHCHMTHHVMNQMGDNFPNMIGVKPGKGDEVAKMLMPNYMLMGSDGMGEMGKHIQGGMMPAPRNSIPMVGGQGQFDYITMGGLFTILKVREGITTYEDPGWYQNPPGTVAWKAGDEELRRDGINVAAASLAPGPGGTKYTCTHHPEVISAKPGNCSKCGMKLTPKKSNLPSATGGSGHKH